MGCCAYTFAQIQAQAHKHQHTTTQSTTTTGVANVDYIFPIAFGTLLPRGARPTKHFLYKSSWCLQKAISHIARSLAVRSILSARRCLPFLIIVLSSSPSARVQNNSYYFNNNYKIRRRCRPRTWGVFIIRAYRVYIC